MIATAAHCLYSRSKGQFMKNVTVNIYNKECSEVRLTTTAKTIHFPENYISMDTKYNDTYVNYDYGLIYVEDDLSNLAANVGVMTDNFMSTNDILTTTGFITYGNYSRYFSSGAIQPMADYLYRETPYRFHSLGRAQAGKSGGMVYYKSHYMNTNGSMEIFKSVTGIVSGSSGEDTYGIRITPTLLRFYKDNNYLS